MIIIPLQDQIQQEAHRNQRPWPGLVALAHAAILGRPRIEQLLHTFLQALRLALTGLLLQHSQPGLNAQRLQKLLLGDWTVAAGRDMSCLCTLPAHTW